MSNLALSVVMAVRLAMASELKGLHIVADFCHQGGS